MIIYNETTISPKKTVICTDEEFVRDFGGVVESEIDLGPYEFDGVIKSEVTFEQNELEQLNESFGAVGSPENNFNPGSSEKNFIKEVDSTGNSVLQNKKSIWIKDRSNVIIAARHFLFNHILKSTN